MQSRLEQRKTGSWLMGALAAGALLLGGRILIEVLWMGLAEAHASEPTVHVLSPVPVLGQLPAFELVDEQGRAFGTRQLRGSLYVLQFVSSADGRSPSAPGQQLARVHEALARRQVSARLVLVERGESTPMSRSHLGDATRGRWTVLGGETQSLWTRFLGLLPLEQEREWTSLTLLVDQSGGVRGLYDLNTNPRALDLLVEDARCVSACGPVPALAGVAPGTVPEGAACDNSLPAVSP